MNNFLVHTKKYAYIIFVFITLVILLGVTLLLLEKQKNTTVGKEQKTEIIAKQRSKPLIVKGSIPYWEQESAFASFTKNTEKFDYINVFWYHLTNDGEIQSYGDTEDKNIVAYAHQHNKGVIAVIANLSDGDGEGWDEDRVVNVLKNRASRKKHIRDIVTLAEKFNFDGVTIDYEGIGTDQKDIFTQFIKELSEKMHAKGKIVTISVYSKRHGSEENFQDWKALAQYADHLHIMAFGEHTEEDSAGPIASIDWVKEIIIYLQDLSIPEEKFVLVIPLFGYDWNKDNDDAADGLTFSDVEKLREAYDKEVLWNEKFASPYFFYEDDDGDKHEVWFENARSVKEKIDLAFQANLGGISFWRLGDEDPEVWNVVNTYREK